MPPLGFKHPPRSNPRFNDLTKSPPFGRLRVLEFDRCDEIGPFPSRRTQKLYYWWCECTCGNIVSVSGYRLRNHITQSCGCLQRERASQANTTHGLSRGAHRSREIAAWAGARERCADMQSHRYGKRGIKVCCGWNDVTIFLVDMGPCPSGLTLDRINNDGHYSCGHCEECVANGWPANCRWATRKQQAENRHTTKLLTYKGKTQSANAWARELGIKCVTIRARKRHGWTDEAALSTTAVVGVNQVGIKPLTYNGKTQSASAWARELGLKAATITQRKRFGWSDAEALSIPPARGNNRH